MRKMRPLNKAAFCPRAGGQKKIKAQSTLEYAVVIFAVVAALMAMPVYIKRAMQGRLRLAAEQFGQQYAPRNTTGTFTMRYTSNTTTLSETLSECGLLAKYENITSCPVSATGYEGYDLNSDGSITDDVFATESWSYLNSAVTNKTRSENVGAMESSLF